MIDALLDGAKKALAQAGVKEENIVIQSVPGSYELPYAVKQYASYSLLASTRPLANLSNTDYTVPRKSSPPRRAS